MRINLLLSLLFGLGQVVVGGVVAWRVLAGKSWRRPSMLLLLALCCWFMVSGATELFVSGLEMAHTMGGAVTSASFALWRARADDFLLVASIVLFVVFTGWTVAVRWRESAARR